HAEWGEKAKITLLCLNAQSPARAVEVDWMLDVAADVPPLARHPLRRTQAAHVAANLAGACKAPGGALLLCPTNAGRLVAVDLEKRQAVWSFTYREPGTPAVPYGAGWVT